jgi:hypothetical protein
MSKSSVGFMAYFDQMETIQQFRPDFVRLAQSKLAGLGNIHTEKHNGKLERLQTDFESGTNW